MSSARPHGIKGKLRHRLGRLPESIWLIWDLALNLLIVCTRKGPSPAVCAVFTVEVSESLNHRDVGADWAQEEGKARPSLLPLPPHPYPRSCGPATMVPSGGGSPAISPPPCPQMCPPVTRPPQRIRSHSAADPGHDTSVFLAATHLLVSYLVLASIQQLAGCSSGRRSSG